MKSLPCQLILFAFAVRCGTLRTSGLLPVSPSDFARWPISCEKRKRKKRTQWNSRICKWQDFTLDSRVNVASKALSWKRIEGSSSSVLSLSERVFLPKIKFILVLRPLCHQIRISAWFWFARRIFETGKKIGGTIESFWRRFGVSWSASTRRGNVWRKLLFLALNLGA